jgi:hypothetical protein
MLGRDGPAEEEQHESVGVVEVVALDWNISTRPSVTE